MNTETRETNISVSRPYSPPDFPESSIYVSIHLLFIYTYLSLFIYSLFHLNIHPSICDFSKLQIYSDATIKITILNLSSSSMNGTENQSGKGLDFVEAVKETMEAPSFPLKQEQVSLNSDTLSKCSQPCFA